MESFICCFECQEPTSTKDLRYVDVQVQRHGLVLKAWVCTACRGDAIKLLIVVEDSNAQ